MSLIFIIIMITTLIIQNLWLPRGNWILYKTAVDTIPLGASNLD